MASCDLQIKLPPFFMHPGLFTRAQMYGFKISNRQLPFPQAYGTEVNYCPSLDLSVYNLSDWFIKHISGFWDKGYSFRLSLLKTRPKSQSSTLPSNFYLNQNFPPPLFCWYSELLFLASIRPIEENVSVKLPKSVFLFTKKSS